MEINALQVEDTRTWQLIFSFALHHEFPKAYLTQLTHVSQALTWMANPKNLSSLTHMFVDGDLPDGRGEKVIYDARRRNFQGMIVFLSDTDPAPDTPIDMHLTKTLLNYKPEVLKKIMTSQG